MEFSAEFTPEEFGELQEAERFQRRYLDFQGRRHTGPEFKQIMELGQR